jgi:hypothetical protein
LVASWALDRRRCAGPLRGDEMVGGLRVRLTRPSRVKLPRVFPTDLGALRVCPGHTGSSIRLRISLRRIPPPRRAKGLARAFAQVKALQWSWWQVKDSNLRSFRDGLQSVRRIALTCTNVRSASTSPRIHRPQTRHHRHRPATSGVIRTATSERYRRRRSRPPPAQGEALLLRDSAASDQVGADVSA